MLCGFGDKHSCKFPNGRGTDLYSRLTPAVLMVSPESALRLLGLAVTQNVFSPTAASRRRRFLFAAGVPLCIRPGANWMPEIDKHPRCWRGCRSADLRAGRPHAVAAGRSRQSRGRSGSRCTTAAYGALCSQYTLEYFMPARCPGPLQSRTGQSIRMTTCVPITALHDRYSIALH